MDTHQMMFEIAIFLFGVGFSYYFARLMMEWPLFGRWLRYFYGLGTAYEYGIKEIITVVLVCLVANIGGIYVFVWSLEYFRQIENLFAIGFCFINYLFLPSLLFNLIRGILQILPISDLDFVRAVEHKEFKTGLRSETNQMIVRDIRGKKYLPRLWRVFFSLLTLLGFYGLPWVFSWLGW